MTCWACMHMDAGRVHPALQVRMMQLESDVQLYISVSEQKQYKY